MRIYKTIKGEKIPFRIKLIPNSMSVEVRFLLSDKMVIGIISNDFNYIILPDNYLSPYISGYGHITVGKLKLDKSAKIDAMYYNPRKTNEKQH